MSDLNDGEQGGLLRLMKAGYTAVTQTPESKKPGHEDRAKCLNSLVGRE
ncbi:hypothetical protein [Pararobbsia alpina]|nr:hypothetical protein [Pararobbsia alpina]